MGHWCPLVDLSTPEASPDVLKGAKIRKEAKEQHDTKQIDLEERNRLLERVHEAELVARCIDLPVRHRLLRLLSLFYEQHDVSYERRLSLQAFGLIRVRLESQEAQFQPMFSPEIRAEKLREYQEEMRAFTDFLKQQYFSEEGQDL